MPKITTGNLNQRVQDNPAARGWIIGHFIKDDPFFTSNDFEVKWARHKKGDVKPGVKATTTSRTLVILIAGQATLSFPETKQVMKLQRQGDFVAFDAYEVNHVFTALTDCIVMVIRWPSSSD